MHNKHYTGVTYPQIDAILAGGNHILIGGIQGAGKSVFLTHLINSLMFRNPDDIPALVLIDPKRVDLCDFKNMRNCAAYCDDVRGARRVLNDLIDTMEARYIRAQKEGVKISRERPIYLIIDELADLVLVDKSLFLPLQRLLAKGRASRIYTICATQIICSSVLPPIARYNFDTKVCLRCDGAMASRLLLGFKGGEELPRYGKAIVKNADGVRTIDVPLLPEGQIERIATAWHR